MPTQKPLPLVEPLLLPPLLLPPLGGTAAGVAGAGVTGGRGWEGAEQPRREKSLDK